MTYPSGILACLCWTAGFLSAAVVTRGPYLQSAGTDRMTVCWRTDVATTDELEFGTDPSGTMTTASNPGTTTDHTVTITGLQAGTRYYYRLKGTPASGTSINVGGNQHWFRTSPATASPTRVWIVGDSGYLYGYAENSFNAFMSAYPAQGKEVDHFMMLGDNAYPWGADSNFQSAVFNRYASLLRNTPMWSVIGNHDVSTVPENHPPAPYFSIFNFPQNGQCGGVASGTESYYSFDHGDIHFVCLDSNTTANIFDAPGGTFGMADWLIADLDACKSNWIVAFMHQGPYSKGSHDSDVEAELVQTRSHIIPILESRGVDLVLCGHSHSYERSMLIDGHYGASGTFNPQTMVKWVGNGSDLGGVNSTGDFVTNQLMAGGVYQKAAATPRSGAVYAVVGASSSVQAWSNGSTALVNPNPHPAHLVNLLAIGSLVLEVTPHRLRGQFIGETGLVRDDFTILKGARYRLNPAIPHTVSGNQGVAFPITRTESTAFAEEVPVSVNLLSGGGLTPTSAVAQFAPGQESALVTFSAASGSRIEATLNMSTASVQPGAAPRNKYSIEPGSQVGQISSSPSATWYASRFGSAPPSSAIWHIDGDNDGLSLLMEYALGGEPGQNDSSLLPSSKIEGGKLVMRYQRSTGRDDLVYQAESSSDLTSWIPPHPSDVPDGPATALGEPRKVEATLGAGRSFLRLKVTLLP